MAIHSEPVEWRLRNGDPRRLQVNAFGFGVSNYVVQWKELWNQRIRLLVSHRERSTQQMDNGASAPEGLHFFRTTIGDKRYRVATVADFGSRGAFPHTGHWVSRNGGPIAPKRLKALARQGIYLVRRISQLRLWLLCFRGKAPITLEWGMNSTRPFPLFANGWIVQQKLLTSIFCSCCSTITKRTCRRHVGSNPRSSPWNMPWCSICVTRIKPQALAGHSLGELTALCLAGSIPLRMASGSLICGDLHGQSREMNVDPGVMMAVDAPLDVLEDLISRREKVYITNINSPHHWLLEEHRNCEIHGSRAERAVTETTLLRVSMAFHSPIMACIHDELEEFIAGIEFHPPQIPVISNTTMQQFPEGSTRSRALSWHILSRRFMDAERQNSLERLWRQDSL